MAAIPVSATAAVILGGTGYANGTTPVGRILSVRPAQLLGKVSYSVYLVHWPLLVVPQTAIGWENPLPLWVKIILAAVGKIRVQRYTKTSCPAADIPATFSSGDPYPECEQWRQAVQAQIAETKPALVLIANYSTAQERNDLDGYERGLAAVLAETEKSAPVVVLQDVPELSADPIACLARNPKSALRCTLPTSGLKAIEDTADYQAARQTGAGFWVTRQWFCTDDACPLIQGEVLVYRDPHHITANFSRVLAAELAPLLAEELNGK